MTHITSNSVRTYLEQCATDEPAYLKAHDIASNLETSPKAIAQYLHRLEDELTDITLTQWGRSKNVTWQVQRDTP
jgi:vacuolar-type H+-ATPase subunit C/Vma6